ncbi:MAG TPA: hypothetical protein EYQ75_25635 [Planctomycetaceae bacterium]|jgi:hypothetical protein|nr:hypothetical protein [Planctomycetaceae bacterium]
MSESAKTTEILETLAKVLIRCTGFGALLLLITSGAWLFLRPSIYAVHGSMFGLSNHEIDITIYAWIGFLKLLVGVLFLFPWLSIKLVLRQSQRAA